MTRHLIFAAVLLAAGVACGEEPLELEWDIGERVDIDFSDQTLSLYLGDSWQPEGCAKGFRPLVVEMPPDFPYETVEFACGRVVEPSEEAGGG